MLLSIRPRLPHLNAVIVAGANAQDRPGLEDALFLDELLHKAEPEPLTAATVSDEVAFWMYTSGSTGDPKAVKHVHTSPMASSRLMGQGVIGIRADDVAFSASKLSFSYGLGNALFFPMSVGASAVLLPERPTPPAVLAAIARHRPTIFYGVPSLYAALLAPISARAPDRTA
jgi:acyl-coenzyme A synthetase/AMP-(fatty) acid ligase